MGWEYSKLNPSLQKRIALAGLAPNPREQSKVKGVMNAHEKDFHVSYLSPRLLTGELLSSDYEGTTLTLAHRCTYTPDFDVRDRDGTTLYFEVKAPHRHREKGVLKLKFAAQSYPESEFYLCEKKKGQWKVTRVPRNHLPPSLIPIDEDDA